MLFGRFFRFVLVGGLATGLQYALLILLVAAAGMGPVLASAIGFVISAVANYYINYHFTFRSSQSHAAALTKFSVLATVGLAINSAIMSGLVTVGVHYVAAQVVATVVVLLWNFAGNHWWTFRVMPGAENPRANGERNSIADLFVRIPAVVWVLLFAACARVLPRFGSDALHGGVLSNAAAAWRMRWAESPNPAFFLDHVFPGSMQWLETPAVTTADAVGLAAGILSVVPLFYLIQRGFGRRAAVIAGFYLAIYESHVLMSRASLSAAVLIFLALCGINIFFGETQSRRPRIRGLLLAGILVTLAGVSNRHGWLLCAAIGGYLLLFRDQRRYAAPFGFLAAAALALMPTLQDGAVEGGGWSILGSPAVGQRGESMGFPQLPAASWLQDAGQFLYSPGPAICALAVIGLYLAMKRQMRCDLAVIAALLAAATALPRALRPDEGGLPEYWVLSGILMLSYAAVATAELRGSRIGTPAVVASVLLLTIAVQTAS